MNWWSSQGDKEKGRQGDSRRVGSSPCHLVTLSPCLPWFLICATMVTIGCHRQGPSTPAPAPRASVALRVLVVNEPAVAESINRLRAEWAERSGGALNASSTTWAEVARAKSLDTDVVIFPSRYLGELCTRGWL